MIYVYYIWCFCYLCVCSYASAWNNLNWIDPYVWKDIVNKCFIVTIKIQCNLVLMAIKRSAELTNHLFCFRGVRPFGVSLLICGWDDDRPYLFQCDPSGAYFAWKATAMGKSFISARTFLEKRYGSNLNITNIVPVISLKVAPPSAKFQPIGVFDSVSFKYNTIALLSNLLANLFWCSLGKVGALRDLERPVLSVCRGGKDSFFQTSGYDSSLRWQ